MLKTILTSMIAFTSVSVFGADLAPTSLRGTYEEVFIQKVFVPMKGYDDNDSVEVTVSGELPNPCYTLSASVAEKGSIPNSYLVRQWAHREMAGPCGSGDLIEDPVPFTSQVRMGHLEVGEYAVEYKQNENKKSNRVFGVEKSFQMGQPDNFNYAITSGIEGGPLFGPNDTVKVSIAGSIHSNCYELDGVPRLEKLDDVFVVLPILKRVSNDCERSGRNFRSELDLGKLAPGSYLIHVRSRNGGSLNQVFEVVHSRIR